MRFTAINRGSELAIEIMSIAREAKRSINYGWDQLKGVMGLVHFGVGIKG